MRFFELRMKSAAFVSGRKGTPFAGFAIMNWFGCAKLFDQGRINGPIPLAKTGAPGPLTDFCFGHGLVPVVSRRVAEIVARLAKQDVQLFDAEVEGFEAPYALVNLTHASDSMDERRAAFERVSPGDPQARFDRFKNVSKLILIRPG